MISLSCWVPRGYASEFPEQYELNDEEMERINQMAQLELTDARADLKQAKLLQPDQDDDLKEYNLESYDDDDNDGEAVLMFPGLSSTEATYKEDEEGDAYLLLPTELEQQQDKQELQIYPTDNLVLATRTEDEVSYLDVYVYDDGGGAPEGSEPEKGDELDADAAKGMIREANLYVHHDLMLPAFPLCVEWVNFRPGSTDENNNLGNFAAIGTFDPQIEVWNLDCVDKAFPDLILGEPAQNSFAAVSKKKKKSKIQSTHHTDAVLSLSHNRTHRSALASTSADKTVKLWDLSQGVAVRSLNSVHSGLTVSLSEWHSQEPAILLTGGYDGAAAVSDVRVADDNQLLKRYKVGKGQEVENVTWGAQPEHFYAGTDNGNVYCFDVRAQDKPLWTLHAHDTGISSLQVNRHIAGMLVTSAMNEKTVKLWKAPAQGGPLMVLSRDFGVGNVLSTGFPSDIEVAGHMTIGGVTAGLKMWDVLLNKSVRSSFRDELKQLQQKARAEAVAAGKASRIARKYQKDVLERLMDVETGGNSESEDEMEAEE